MTEQLYELSGRVSQLSCEGTTTVTMTMTFILILAMAVRFARSTGLLARQVEELLSVMMAPLDQSQGDWDGVSYGFMIATR